MAYDAHDTAVMMRINRIIRETNAKYPGLTVGEKLDQAWAANIRERESDSTNPIGRDADYYFAARKEVANSSNGDVKAGKAALGMVAWVVYAGVKSGSEALGHPEWTRTDPDKPNAPVGGFSWMNRGSSDALGDVGTHVGDISLHSLTGPIVPRELSPGGVRRGLL